MKRTKIYNESYQYYVKKIAFLTFLTTDGVYFQGCSISGFRRREGHEKWVFPDDIPLKRLKVSPIWANTGKQNILQNSLNLDPKRTCNTKKLARRHKKNNKPPGSRFLDLDLPQSSARPSQLHSSLINLAAS